MAGKRFLSGIRTPYLTDLDDPIMPLDAANRQWVLSLITASTQLPAGGLSGYVLTKLTDADFDVGWIEPSNNPGNPFGNSGMGFNGGTFTIGQNAVLSGGTF